MNTVRPRPYPQRGTGNYNAGNTGTDADGHNQNGQEQQQQHREVVARGRAEDVQQPQGQPRQAIYSPAVNAYSQKSAFPNQTSPMQGASYPMQGHQINPQQYQAAQTGYQPIPQQAQETAPVQKPAQRSNKINIAQILKDFRNTIKAIATPPEIEEDVNHYLKIVEEQVREPKPQVNLIQSNLKIAASLLDKYISETLKKESKVVQNWLDALFLQRINYSYDAEDINPSFLVRFPEDNKKQPEPEQPKQEEIVEEPQPAAEIEDYEPETLEIEYTQAQEKISTKPNITIIPQDTRLKSLFMEAKKQAFSNNPQKAMAMFKEAFNRAGEIKDNETQSRICLEIGKIYDDNDFVVQALNSYNKSLQYTTDTNVKSKAHYSMAQIYDDVNQVGAALEHYITSISYAGKTDDLIGQSDSLTRVANIFTDKYDETNAFDYYEVARKLVEQTGDNNMKGYVLSNTADACVQFRKNDKALKYYAEAVKNYETTNALEEIAENYKSAAELMIEFNSPNKAKSLLKKALVNAVKTKNEDLISEINLLLASVA
ncbi:MAG: hypothetical protein NC408_07265 [Candidatus Gastranaerophilales bacterium]|nr:hypothetical protein [Candidatus Gastranaerophilales bacterium]MCM1072902.1 hypothetical protein [Bacteroides sp.]